MYDNECEEMGFSIEVQECVSRICNVSTADYVIDTDYDEDERHPVDIINTTGIEWVNLYKYDCYTILELIDELKKLLDEKLSDKNLPKSDRIKYKKMRNDCEDWKSIDIMVDQIQPI